MRSISRVVIAVVALSCSLLAQDSSQAVVVTVNADAISRTEFDRLRRERINVPLGTMLVDLVDERLLFERGRSLGYELGDEQYEAILENLKRQNDIASDAQFDLALARSNLTRAQLRRNLERAVIAARVLRDEALAQITDADARRYFDAHLDEFPLQTFEDAKDALLPRLKADASTHNVLVRPYLLSLRRAATIVWMQPDLRQAYEQAAR